MVELPFELLFNILNYNYNINILLNKEYYLFIKTIRDNFRKDPLILKYNLVKCRQKIGETTNQINNTPHRKSPSVRVMDEKIYKLRGNVPLGTILENKIQISPELKEILIPPSERFVYPYYLWNFFPNAYVLIYWDIFKITATNMKRASIYIQLNK